ncbi:MAG TPA: c-type cytochrome [Thermoanaerobaculia bacterium]|nr:c-type cytochrome [Thermoanaerobaculia bacterium]
MKRLLKFVGRSFAVLAVLIGLFAIVVLVRAGRTFEAPYPAVTASKDPAVIERGAYIVYGAGHCVNCHTSEEEKEKVHAGERIPLAGGLEFRFPLGSFFTPNLTPDRETGIGRRSDAELARMLRHGVRADGRAALPFMQVQNMSEEDLVAVISFLRSQPPVRRTVPEHRPTFLGKAVLAFLIKPEGPTGPILKSSPAEAATVERGDYVANRIAVCWECHTKRSEVDGSYVNARFSGGGEFRLDNERVIVTPNLTPSKSGRITSWDEEQFVGRFGAGVGIEGTHMPWRQFQAMSDADKRAVYRYLRTLPPSTFDPGPSVQVRKKGKDTEEKRQVADAR